ncbi:MAG: glycosyltransferase, partial [Deltaproteobacteria bacterium]
MRILVATDASAPQVNGVVTTYRRLSEELPRHGAWLSFLTPETFRTVRMPGYPDIRLAIPRRKTCELHVAAAEADHIHIATEGPVGWMVRNYCLRRGLPFTTSFHTRFPEYAAYHFGLPRAPVYAALRHFHNAGGGTMVAAPSLRRELARHGFRNVLGWTRGVDTDQFFPRQDRLFGDCGPVFLYVGR